MKKSQAYEPLTRRIAGAGVWLAADFSGPETGPGVILLHGGGQTRHSWAEASHRMARRGYRVVNYDARGHGDSDWSPGGDYTLSTLGKDLLAVRATLNAPTAFVGASIGGLTSFYAAATGEPPPAEALVMVDIALRPAQAGAERIGAFMAAHPEGFATLDDAVAAVAAYNPDRPPPADPSGLARNLRRRADGRLYWHWDPRLIVDEDDGQWIDRRYQTLVEVSPRMTIPTLLVRGRRSDILTDENVADMIRVVPQTEVLEVAGAGHMIAGDRNDVFVEGVLEFLMRHHPPR